MSALSNQYSDPEFNITREVQFDRAAITASTVYIAQFVARARMYVTNIVIGVRSVASVAALNAAAGHAASPGVAFSAIAGATASWISATSVGSYQTIALNRTLAIGEKVALLFNDAKGKVHVMYEYQILPA